MTFATRELLEKRLDDYLKKKINSPDEVNQVAELCNHTERLTTGLKRKLDEFVARNSATVELILSKQNEANKPRPSLKPKAPAPGNKKRKHEELDYLWELNHIQAAKKQKTEELRIESIEKLARYPGSVRVTVNNGALIDYRPAGIFILSPNAKSRQQTEQLALELIHKEHLRLLYNLNRTETSASEKIARQRKAFGRVDTANRNDMEVTPDIRQNVMVPYHNGLLSDITRLHLLYLITSRPVPISFYSGGMGGMEQRWVKMAADRNGASDNTRTQSPAQVVEEESALGQQLRNSFYAGVRVTPPER